MLYGLSSPDLFPLEFPNTLTNPGVYWTRSDFSEDWNTEELFALVAAWKVCYAAFTLILPPEIAFI